MGMAEMGGMGAAGAGLGAAGVISVLKYILITLGGGVLLGLIGGLVYAGVRYPNPNKRQVFSAKQKIIVMAVAVLGVAMIVFAFVKKPGGAPAGGDIMVNAMVDKMTGLPQTDDQGRVLDQEGNPLTDADGNFVGSDGTPIPPDAIAPEGEPGAENSTGEVPADGDAASGEGTGDEAASEGSSGEETASAESSVSVADAPTGGSAGTGGGGGGGGTVIMGGNTAVFRVG